LVDVYVQCKMYKEYASSVFASLNKSWSSTRVIGWSTPDDRQSHAGRGVYCMLQLSLVLTCRDLRHPQWQSGDC
jgi:hypothetical protein